MSLVAELGDSAYLCQKGCQLFGYTVAGYVADISSRYIYVYCTMKQSGFVRCTRPLLLIVRENLQTYNNLVFAWMDDGNPTRKNIKDKEDIVQADNRGSLSSSRI